MGPEGGRKADGRDDAGGVANVGLPPEKRVKRVSEPERDNKSSSGVKSSPELRGGEGHTNRSVEVDAHHITTARTRLAGIGPGGGRNTADVDGITGISPLSSSVGNLEDDGESSDGVRGEGVVDDGRGGVEEEGEAEGGAEGARLFRAGEDVDVAPCGDGECDRGRGRIGRAGEDGRRGPGRRRATTEGLDVRASHQDDGGERDEGDLGHGQKMFKDDQQ